MAWTLYYDAGCNLCHASELRIERWASRAGQPLDVDVLQSEAAAAKGFDPSAMVLEVDGKVYLGADAWMRICTIGPWYVRWIAAMRFTPPTRWLAQAGYWLVDKLRYRMFGRRECRIDDRPSSSAESRQA